MGADTRVYKVKGLNDLTEAERIIKLIRSKIVNEPKCEFTFGFKLTDVQKYPEIALSFPVQPRIDYDLQFAVEDIATFFRLIASNHKFNRLILSSWGGPNYNSFWVALDVVRNQLTVDVYFQNLNTTEAKTHIAFILRALIKQEILFVMDAEIEPVIDSLMELSSKKLNGAWSYEDRFGIQVNNQFARLKFDSNYLHRWQPDSVDWTARFIEVLNANTKNPERYSGFYTTYDIEPLIDFQEKNPMIDLSTFVGLDLSEERDFDLKRLVELSHSGEEMEINLSGFKWPHEIERSGELKFYFEENRMHLELHIHYDHADIVDQLQREIGYELEGIDWI